MLKYIQDCQTDAIYDLKNIFLVTHQISQAKAIGLPSPAIGLPAPLRPVPAVTYRFLSLSYVNDDHTLL